MVSDPWHYSRAELAKQILGMFESGLSSALIFFAPRRMGKTEFLCKDILPFAEKRNWKVSYFSFLDIASTATTDYTKALLDFAEKNGLLSKTLKLLNRVSKISGEAVGVKAGIQFHDEEASKENMKAVIKRLASQGKVLLLMDEVQALAQYPANTTFIAALRTSLDIHKDNIKVIFTGSSQEGLRRMFSQAKAPFFHFGQNLPFPALNRGFTDHLAQVFHVVTQRKLNTDTLWDAFQEMQQIPQLARSLVERLALNPNLTIELAKKELLSDVFENRAFTNIWEHCSALERLLLQEIAEGKTTLFSIEMRSRMAKILGIKKLLVPSVQSAMRVLQRKGLIGQLTERGGYFIDDPNFKNWLQQ